MGRRDLMRGLMFLLFFLSGISGLVYQIVWTRQLVLVFGNTLLALSTVLTAFMAGLAAGSYTLGRHIDAKPRRLIRLYALLEAGIGGFALIFPLLLAAATPLYTGLYRLLEGNIALLNLVRFGVCFGLILIPTFLMGGTLPVLIKRFVEGDRTIGHQTGFLYGLNTAGAMVGCLASGYFLLRVVGMQQTTWVAVAINLGVAAVAWALSRDEVATGEVDQASAMAAVETDVEAPRHGSVTVNLVLVGIGLSGFCALAYEVFWTRMLNLFLNNNIYSFTAVLATFLAGIALGSLVYSAFLSRVSRPVALFAGIEIAIGLMAYATPFVFNLLHRTLFFRQSETLTLAKTAVIMIAPTVLMGIAVPLAVEIYKRGPQREGTTVGTVYAVNTIGAILGAFAAGFVLIPTVGLHRGLIVAVSLNLLAGFLPLTSEARPACRPIWAGAFIGAVALLFLAAPATLFRGLYEKYQPTAEILHYKEGKIANVVVYDFVKSGYKDLYLNAIEEASSRIWHVQLFKMLGILPVMVHPQPDNALMIAFGAGMSAGACVDEVEGLDCVDLNPDIAGVAGVFTHENRDVINNPGLNVIVNDGRNALLLDPKQYSLIISDATNPKTFDSWTLYTREFYQLVESRLKPGGVFAQWVVMPLPYDSLRILLNTFKSVFPHTSFWCIYGSSQCIMLGTPERLQIDYQSFSSRLGPMLERVGLTEYGVEDIDKFLSFMLLGEDELEQALAGFSKINTDDLPVAQFRIRGDLEGVQDFLHLLRYQTPILPYLKNLGGEEQRVEATLETYRSLARRLTLGFLLKNQGEYREAEALARRAGMAEDENIKSALKYDSERRSYFSRRVAAGEGDANDHNSLGYIYWQEGDYARAIAELERAVELSPDFAQARANLARVYTDAGRYYEATESWMEVREISPSRDLLSASKRQLEIIHLLRRLCYQPGSSALYDRLGELLLADGQTVRAARATKAAAESSQGDPEIYLRLARLYENLEFVDRALETYETLVALVPEDERFLGAVEFLETLQSDPVSTQNWLNSNKIVFETDQTGDQHPASCRQARETWNEVPFEGKLGRDKLARAAALYEESIDAKGDELHAYADAARIHELLGEYDRAAALWRRGLEVVPGNRTAENNIRRLELLGQSDDSEKLVEIGQLFRFNGEIDRAVEFFSRAVDANERDFSAWAHLAAGYDQVGRYHDAARAYRRALELQPDGAAAGVIQDSLVRLEGLLGNCVSEARTEDTMALATKPGAGSG